MSKNPPGSVPDPKGKGPGEKEKTLIIPHELPESATESLEAEGLQESVTENVGGSGAPGETEEVFVILPEDDGEGGSLPVVETVVVEDQPWDAGPTTTEVLKDVPSELGAGNPSSTSELKEVPLLKVNPLSEGETENLPEDADLAGTLPAAGGKEEEIKVIDEIADIAADLEHDEPLEEDAASGQHSISEPTTGLVTPVASGSSRVRWVALATTLAALVLLGVFFYPDLEKLYHRYAGGESVAGGTVQALSPPAGSGSAGAVAPSGVDLAEREELRARIHLALRVGLRADAGKE